MHFSSVRPQLLIMKIKAQVFRSTGMKCLPASKIPEANGVGLHDWHAEVLAIRTFNSYILDECLRMIDTGSSDLLEKAFASDGLAGPQPFCVQPGIKLHMYASEAPCTSKCYDKPPQIRFFNNHIGGDASMENLMAAQDDASPWDIPTRAETDLDGVCPQLPGRAYFSQLGVVRRKPARSDAPPTLSKSCSDKLALKQCTSLLASVTSLFVDPTTAYIDTLVLPKDQYSDVACQRAFSATGRMSAVASQTMEGGYEFRPFSIATTTVQFKYSRRTALSCSDKIAASNLAAAWSLSGIEESILGGVIQGYKPFLPKGASRMSRRRMWQYCCLLAGKLEGRPAISEQLTADAYGKVKHGPLLDMRNNVKSRVREVALPGWIQNTGDDTFGIDQDKQGKQHNSA